MVNSNLVRVSIFQNLFWNPQKIYKAKIQKNSIKILCKLICIGEKHGSYFSDKYFINTMKIIFTK